MAKIFKLHSKFSPAGDQPQAINLLQKAADCQALLLGVTGSGKTFTLANVIANQDRQVLILSPNKTLAAQLYEEFCEFFPENKVCYFVSYFDFYQPESYIPSSDTYIEKNTKVNAEIERLRVEATASLVNRPDTIIIASVSAIYSLGNPQDYKDLAFKLSLKQKISRQEILEKIIALQYTRNDSSAASPDFRVQGGKITINLPYLHNNLRIQSDEGVITELSLIDKLNENTVMELDNFILFPAKHFVTPEHRVKKAIQLISQDLEAQLEKIEDLVIKSRLQTRVNHDLAMLQATGYCNGIENYSSYLDDRNDKNRPFCLLDFFDPNFLFIIDESHIAIPQLQAMYRGDRTRKQTLVDFGFRLPSALENRPLQFEEIETFFHNTIFVSATPSEYEKEHASTIAEQIARPTGIVDPEIEIHPRVGQLDHLLTEIEKTIAQNYRTLITVLTKKSAEELAKFLEKKDLKVCYLHSEIKTTERTEILHKLRQGVFDVLVGINLLREGLDLPEVALVAILDADIEGFLRNERSLIQTIGRAARNINGKVLFYADKTTNSMQRAIDETNRRRAVQQLYNEKHKIKEASVTRDASKTITHLKIKAPESRNSNKPSKKDENYKSWSIQKLQAEMMDAAQKKNFKKAIQLRELIKKIQTK